MNDVLHHGGGRDPGDIRTGVAEVVLRPLTPDDLDAYRNLIAHNGPHLGKHGDFADERAAPHLASLPAQGAEDHGFGIRYAGELAGIVTLCRRDAGSYVIGYWVDEGHTGRGIATAACRAAIDFAASRLGATDIWAGVTHGNDVSERLLLGLGFADEGDQGAYTRFHRRLT